MTPNHGGTMHHKQTDASLILVLVGTIAAILMLVAGCTVTVPMKGDEAVRMDDLTVRVRTLEGRVEGYGKSQAEIVKAINQIAERIPQNEGGASDE